jgi:hypothetical protein
MRMNKAVLGAAAAVVLGGAVFATSAQAQCWWDGFTWACTGPAAPAYSYYEPYAGVPWQTYPVISGDGYWGYKPQWLPSYPGPRPSSRAGQ